MKRVSKLQKHQFYLSLLIRLSMLSKILLLIAIVQAIVMAEKYPGQEKDLQDPTQRPNAKKFSSYNMTKHDQQLILTTHNILRNRHEKIANLTWNNTLASYAAKFVAAYDCASGTIEHSDYDFGENIAIGLSLNGSVNGWYNEIKSYDFSKSEFSESTGHFTQVVWKNTKQVGCAVRYCNSYWGNLTVCEYDPSGNWDGEFQKNVNKLKAVFSTKTGKQVKKAKLVFFDNSTSSIGEKTTTMLLRPSTSSSSSQIPTSSVATAANKTVSSTSFFNSSSHDIFTNYEASGFKNNMTNGSIILLIVSLLNQLF